MVCDYPVADIRAYRERMAALADEASVCRACADVGRETNVYKTGTLCTEHAAVAAVHHMELTRISPRL